MRALFKFGANDYVRKFTTLSAEFDIKAPLTGNDLGPPFPFNLMFETRVSTLRAASSVTRINNCVHKLLTSGACTDCLQIGPSGATAAEAAQKKKKGHKVLFFCQETPI